ncbi:MAG: hypothetical protein HN909_03560 [Phycisphaerales bacterium]|jgi:Na+-translocating ferredoxin:NAD+ oxidoreductase RnfD subunit|nr:hypothetical protein [Phycisphaerales bacterium]MBT7170829.1 hypothetical protein [Phycisphaerales bacterium]
MSGTIRTLPPTSPPGGLLHGGERTMKIYRAWTLAMALPLGWSVVVFGWRAAWMIIACLAGAMLTQHVVGTMRGRNSETDQWRAARWGAGMALLLYATMPTWLAVLLGSGAVLAGMLDEKYEPRIHPAVWVRVLFVAMLGFGGVLSWNAVTTMQTRGGVLSRDVLVLGDVTRSTSLEGQRSWGDDPRALAKVSTGRRDPLLGCDAVEQERLTMTLAPLTAAGESPRYGAVGMNADLETPHGDALGQAMAMRDIAFGVRYGMLGEVSAIGILLAGLFLVYRGYVRLVLPVGVLLGAALTATVWPVQLLEIDGATSWHWFGAFYEGADVGLVYVGYHILGGVVMMGAFFLATEMRLRPIMTRGQFYYGAFLGVMMMGGQLLFPAWPLAGLLAGMSLWSVFCAIRLGVSQPMKL